MVATRPMSKADLIERVGTAVRRMGAQSVITSAAIAARFGLHTTDLECLDVLFLRGEATAGELAKATGLTSGAMTALLDRLERAGYVSRGADPTDRRRVLLRIRPEAIRSIQAVYEPLAQRSFELWSGFSRSELEIVERFLTLSTDLVVSYAEEVQGRAGSRTGPDPNTAS